MRKHTPLMKTVRQWQPLTRELFMLAASGDLALMTLSRAELEDVRSAAATLAGAVAGWCDTHRPVPTRVVAPLPSERT